jgi:chromosome segregation ATPase
MKNDAEVVSDFLQALRAGGSTVDRIELDLAIDALDSLVSEYADDLNEWQERAEDAESRVEEAESRVEELEWERDDNENNAAEMEEERDLAREERDKLVALLSDWADDFARFKAAPAGPEGEDDREAAVKGMSNTHSLTTEALETI